MVWSSMGIILCLMGFLFLWIYSIVEETPARLGSLVCSFLCLFFSSGFLLVELNLDLKEPFKKAFQLAQSNPTYPSKSFVDNNKLYPS